MNTLKNEIDRLQNERVVDLNHYRMLKNLQRLRRDLRISDQTLIRTDEGVWSIAI